MGLAQVVQSVAAISAFVLCVQSARLFISSRLKVSLFFCMFFLFVTALNIAGVMSALTDVPDMTEKLILTAISALCLVYVVYVELRSRVVFWITVCVGLGILSLVTRAPVLVQTAALTLPIAGLVLHMIIQTKESAGQVTATARMVLLTLSVLSVAWANYIVYMLGGQLSMTLSFVFSTALLLTILALTSFLTPIHTKDSVKQTVY